MPVYPPIIEVSELKECLEDPLLVVLDARTGKQAEAEYLAGHIQGALFADLEKDWSATSQLPSQGGRHPLPDLFDFAKTVSDLGITAQSRVVVYDAQGGANAAARVWWMLRAFGIDWVRVLNGGWSAALAYGLPMGSGEEAVKKSVVKIPDDWMLPTVSLEEVEQKLSDGSALVIDVRESSRYRGDFEPIDTVAGHIPGAINFPFSENLNAEGFFLGREALRMKYAQSLKKDIDCIVHCGSGVTACHTVLAMVLAGFPPPSLYVGSWSEWSRRAKPIVSL